MNQYKWKDGRHRVALPIDNKLEEIQGLIHNHQVVVVEAETGAGKTLRLGQAAVLADPTRRVTMTQTRRNACRWNGKKIAEEMGSQPGGLVGWRLSAMKENFVSQKTGLVLTMTQSLVNNISRNGGKLPKGLLIIDEAHERSKEVDLLLGLIKEGLPRCPNTKVLVTSATIDAEKFSKFFGSVPVVKVAGRCFPVSTEVVRLNKYEHHTQGAARAASVVLDRFLAGKLEIPTTDGEGRMVVTKGTVLVLLPGKEDITAVMAAITRNAQRCCVEVLSCHGESSRSEQDAVQRPVPDGVLRFVCGTEILRSSVTIPDTCGVIDSLQIKRKVCDAKGVMHQQKIPVSRAEADQAKGRAGRTAAGFYMPVSFDREYEGLQPWPQPAILREAVTSTTLEIAAVGRSIRDFPFLDAPQHEKIEVAIRRLQALGALDEKEIITDKGKLLVRFPIEPERAATLVAAQELGVLEEAVIVAAALEAEGIFQGVRGDQIIMDAELAQLIRAHLEKKKHISGWRILASPSVADMSELPEWIQLRPDGRYTLNVQELPCDHGARWVTDLVRKVWAGEDKSDFVAIVGAYRALKAEESRLKVKAPDGKRLSERAREKYIRDWCFARGVNLKRFRIMEDKLRQIKDDIHGSGLNIGKLNTAHPFDAKALTKALLSGMVDNLARKESGRTYRGRLGEFEMAHQSQCQDTPLVLTAGVNKIPVRGGRGKTAFMLLADTCAPVTSEWIEEMLPHLCSRKRLGDHVYNRDMDEVVENEVCLFQGDLEISRRTVRSEDQIAAQERFAKWVTGTDRNSLPESIKKVMEANADRQQVARDLNQRADAVVFQEYSKTEEYEYIRETLNGARTLRGIVDPSVLRLPEIDREARARILAENPSTVSILGKDWQVRYQMGQHPHVIIEVREMQGEYQWMDLPDEPVRLPGGKVAGILLRGVSDGNWLQSVDDTDIPRLKEKATGIVNRQLFEKWTDRPTIPDATLQGDIRVPFVSAVYGSCKVTGKDLTAYGTHQPSYYSGSYTTVAWYADKREAETARAESIDRLNEKRKEIERRVQLESLQKEAEAIREELRNVENCDGWSDLDWAVRDGASRYRYASFHDTETTRGYIESATSALKRVADALEEVKRRKEESRRLELELDRQDRDELAPLLQRNGDNLDEAREVRDALCELCEVYQERDVLRILKEESNAPYGRERRQSALEKAFPDMVEMKASRLLGFYRAKDLNHWLDLGVLYLEAVMQVSLGDGSFAEVGNRYFKCGCGCQTRVSRSDWAAYINGQSLTVHCDVCDAKGSVQKSLSTTEQSESAVTQGNMKSSLDALKLAWGAK